MTRTAIIVSGSEHYHYRPETDFLNYNQILLLHDLGKRIWDEGFRPTLILHSIPGIRSWLGTEKKYLQQGAEILAEDFNKAGKVVTEGNINLCRGVNLIPEALEDIGKQHETVIVLAHQASIPIGVFTLTGAHDEKTLGDFAEATVLKNKESDTSDVAADWKLTIGLTRAATPVHMVKVCAFPSPIKVKEYTR